MWAWAREHSLALVLAAAWLTLTALSAVLGLGYHEADQRLAQGADTSGDYLTWWTWEYLTSILADVFGFGLIVILTHRLRERGSTEGPD